MMTQPYGSNLWRISSSVDAWGALMRMRTGSGDCMRVSTGFPRLR